MVDAVVVAGAAETAAPTVVDVAAASDAADVSDFDDDEPLHPARSAATNSSDPVHLELMGAEYSTDQHASFPTKMRDGPTM